MRGRLDPYRARIGKQVSKNEITENLNELTASLNESSANGGGLAIASPAELDGSHEGEVPSRSQPAEQETLPLLPMARVGLSKQCQALTTEGINERNLFNRWAEPDPTREVFNAPVEMCHDDLSQLSGIACCSRLRDCRRLQVGASDEGQDVIQVEDVLRTRRGV